MSSSSPKIKDMSIVLLGSFNPAIFHPQWLVRKEIILESEINDKTLKVSHPEVSEIVLETCDIQVLQNRFAISSSFEHHFSLVKDYVIGIFNHLPESIVNGMGINIHHHYEFNNEEKYVSFGHNVVPKDGLWNDCFKGLNPSLETIKIQADRPDEYEGKVNTTIKISNKVRPLGIEIQVNDHYDTKEGDGTVKKSLEILSENWENSINYSNETIKKVYSYGIS